MKESSLNFGFVESSEIERFEVFPDFWDLHDFRDLNDLFIDWTSISLPPEFNRDLFGSFASKTSKLMKLSFALKEFFNFENSFY